MRTSAFFGVVLMALVAGGCRDTDRQIEARVMAQLAEDPEGSRVGVDVDGRVVRITGVVDSSAESTRLENRVAHVPGVLAVRNELVVAAPVETTSALTEMNDIDRAVAATVDAQLAARGFEAVDVTVSEGTVQLRGELAPGRREEALEVARRAAPAFRIDDLTSAR